MSVLNWSSSPEVYMRTTWQGRSQVNCNRSFHFSAKPTLTMYTTSCLSAFNGICKYGTQKPGMTPLVDEATTLEREKDATVTWFEPAFMRLV